MPLVRATEILMLFCSRFLLYSRAHLDRSAFLTLNIHCPVEYDQGSAKEDHFVM